MISHLTIQLTWLCDILITLLWYTTLCALPFYLGRKWFDGWWVTYYVLCCVYALVWFSLWLICFFLSYDEVVKGFQSRYYSSTKKGFTTCLHSEFLYGVTDSYSETFGPKPLCIFLPQCCLSYRQLWLLMDKGMSAVQDTLGICIVI